MTSKEDRETLLRLYEIYDSHRDSLIWFLDRLDARTYEQYQTRYSSNSHGKIHFTTVCGFFELSGVLVKSRMIDENIYFEVFNPNPFWEKAESIVIEMRRDRPHMYENFELLNNKRIKWTKKRGQISHKRYV